MAEKINAELAAMLRKCRDKFAAAEPAESFGGVNRKVPDGTYTSTLDIIEFDKMGKRPIIRFIFTIKDADKKSHETAIGESVETRFGLDTDEGPMFIKRDFGKFGYDEISDLLDDLEESDQLFQQIIDANPLCKIAVAMSDDDQWQNVYLNDVLEMDEVTEKAKPKESLPEPSEINKLNELAKDSGPKPIEQDLSKLKLEEGDEIEELKEGDFVEVDFPDKPSQVGKVLTIDEDAGTVKVQINKPRKRVVVPVEDVFLVDK